MAFNIANTTILDDSRNFVNVSNVTVTGTLTANYFVGSGSGLTGVSGGSSNAVDSAVMTTVTPVAGAVTLNLTTNRNFNLNCNTSITSLAFSNVPTVAKIKLAITNSTSITPINITWPSSIFWNKGNAPSLLSNWQSNTIATLLTTDAGTKWYGWIENADMSKVGAREMYVFSGYDGQGLGGAGDANYADVSPKLIGGGGLDWGTLTPGGYATTYQLKSDGSIWSWGRERGQFGGDGVIRSTPCAVGAQFGWFGPNFATWRFKKITSCGEGGLVALRQDGTLWALGNNVNGCLGVNSGLVNLSSPVQIGSATNWVNIMGGARNQQNDGGRLFVVNSNGEMYASGNNAFGQLGLGDTVNRSSLSLVLGGISWYTKDDETMWASDMYASSLVLSANNDLYVWGHNTAGQLGLGDTVHKSTPVKLGTSKWRQVALGDRWQASDVSGLSGFAIRDDNTLWAWGNNSDYVQLGTGNATNYSSPVQVATDKRFKRVVSFSGTTLAICLDGTMWGAGLGQYGLLGNGIGQGAYSTFVQSGGGRQWVDVQMNRYANSYAIRDPKL